MNELHDFDELDEHANSPERERAAKRTTWVSVAVNLGLTLTQVIAGLWSGSQGLVADGIHSLSDLVADFVVLLALRHSRKAPDANPPATPWKVTGPKETTLRLLR